MVQINGKKWKNPILFLKITRQMHLNDASFCAGNDYPLLEKRLFSTMGMFVQT